MIWELQGAVWLDTAGLGESGLGLARRGRVKICPATLRSSAGGNGLLGNKYGPLVAG